MTDNPEPGRLQTAGRILILVGVAVWAVYGICTLAGAEPAVGLVLAASSRRCDPWGDPESLGNDKTMARVGFGRLRSSGACLSSVSGGQRVRRLPMFLTTIAPVAAAPIAVVNPAVSIHIPAR